MTFTASADTRAFDAYIDELEEGIEEAVRPAAQAAAQVLYDAVKQNVASLGRKSGNLDKSIYQAFSPEESRPGSSVYRISWNHLTAPHGRLIELGYIQRYASYVGKDGKWYTAVRRGVKGKVAKPGRRATQAQKDAYYVPLPAPRQIPPKAFLRQAQSVFPKALDAMETEFLRRLK